MNILDELLKDIQEDPRKFAEKLDIIERMSKGLVRKLGLDSSESDDLCQDVLTAVLSSPQLTSRNENWQSYIRGMLFNIASKKFGSNKLVPGKWARVCLSGEADEPAGGPARHTLEELTSDGHRSADEAFQALEAEAGFAEWEKAYAENFDRIWQQEIDEISSDPLFREYVRLIREDGLDERAAYRSIAGSGPSKSFPQFNRYFVNLKRAVRERWQAEHLPLPEHLRLEQQGDLSERWKRAAVVVRDSPEHEPG